MRLKSLRPGFVCAFLCAGAFAFARPQGGEVAKLIELGRSDSQVMDHLDHLVNRIGPRLTSSDNLQNACEWARAEFESYGLSNCRLEKWGEFPVGFNRGPASGRMLEPEAKELHFGTNSWTAGTRGPARGPVLVAPKDETELAALKGKLKGAWILVPSATPRNRTGATPPAANAGTNGGANGGTPREASAPAAGADTKTFRDNLQKAYETEGILGTIRATRNELILTGGNQKIAFDKLPK